VSIQNNPAAPEQIIGAIDLRTKENGNRGFWLGLP